MRIAMWSGPRNLSTAMMYAFAQRADFTVLDEPFYGPYLRKTGLDHPMRAEILADRAPDADSVDRALRADPPGGLHAYDKHMCQHMIPGMPRDFMAHCTNVFLLRHPARVVTSFLREYPQANARDTGFALQAELFDHVRALGQTPVVVDSADIRDDPQGMLRALCDALGLDWDPAMLHWPKGPKPYDGVWAPVWYRSLHATTGFAGPEGPLPALDRHAEALVAECLPHYDAMAARAIKI